ncbi:MAG: CsgG/HfaB family protein [Calditrichia bacterium]
MLHSGIKVNIKIRTVLLFLVMLFFLFSCAPSLIEVPSKKPAHLGYVTSIHKDLVALPAPKEPIVVAVYKFRDQTGQYKTSSTGVSWSTAVTQGATSMLLKALEDSRWFTVIEREGLSNLLNERKIIRSSRENYSTQDGDKLPPLPPLLYAGIILEGGIVSYETNTVTGGVGAKYFGIGGSTQYRKDEVSIYLRAVSTQTGRVLKTVYTTKSILSMSVDVGVYRYVRFKRLLEVETGFSVNEPPQMCVLEAIEKAVVGMVLEGVMDNLWALENPQDVHAPVVLSYLKERDEVEGKIDFHASPNLSPRFFGLGMNGGAQIYTGDYTNEKLRPVGEAFLRFNFSPRFSLLLNGYYGRVADKEHFDTGVRLAELKGQWMILPQKRISPFLTFGGGIIDYWPQSRNGVSLPVDKTLDEPRDDIVASLVYGLGVEYFYNKHFSLQALLDHRYTFTDQLDGMPHGRRKDGIMGFKLGVTYYLAQ